MNFDARAFFEKNLDFEFWSDSWWFVEKNGLDEDFLENGKMDFADIGNLDEPIDTLSIRGGSMIPKNLDLELWIDFGWCTHGVLDKSDYLRIGSNDFSDFWHGVVG